MPRKVHELNAVHPADCLFAAQVRSDFADYTWFYDQGYIRYLDGTKLMLREHQRIAMVAYGVPSGYDVHHIDGNTLNNRADNLAVLSHIEHMQLHGSMRRRCMTIICAVCKSPFDVPPGRIKKSNPTYCSNSCRTFGRRVVARPTAEQLSELLISVGNWTALGEMFGVSDNAVRKWARRYNLDLSVCNGWFKQ